jgi:hypothetical protein
LRVLKKFIAVWKNCNKSLKKRKERGSEDKEKRRKKRKRKRKINIEKEQYCNMEVIEGS